MAAPGGHPHTWLCVACFVLCGCGSKKPAAVGGGDGGSELVDAGTGPVSAADGGAPSSESGGGGGGGGELPGSGDSGSDACVPASCESLGAQCGAAEDRCGGSLDCGTCGDDELCDANECRSCTALSCEELGWQCGSGSDGCSGTVDCGMCPGEPCYEHACCDPRACAADACGEVSDGCGGSLDCGPCTNIVVGRVCGHVGAGVCLGPDAEAQPTCSCELPAVCDPRNGGCCVPLVCADLCKTGAYDGSDGCGNALRCDPCLAPKKK